MKKYITKAILIYMAIHSTQYVTAQGKLTANYAAPNNHNITYTVSGVPRSLVPNTTAPYTKTNPGYALWYEYGDGYYTTLPTTQHGTAAGTISVAKVTEIYEGGSKPPPTRIVAPPSTGTGRTPAQESNNLAPGMNVSITPNISTISHNDTMHFAISYKKPTQEKGWKLIFEYNSNGDNAFKQTNATNTLVDHEGNGNTRPFVRTHAVEQITYATHKVEFSNMDAITKYADVGFNTVYVTMVPNTNVTLNGLVKAYWVNRNAKENNTESNSTELELPNNGPGPHDPNYIKVTQSCLQRSTLNKVLDYHLHFQNTGLGPAIEKIKITIDLPIGILASQIIPTLTSQAKFSNYAVTGYTAYNSATTPTPILANNYLGYDNATSPNQLILYYAPSPRPSNHILSGMVPTNPNYMSDPATTGDFYFSIQLTQNYPAGTLLKAKAAIIFDGELPVDTELEIIKVVQSCKRKPAPCNCKGTKKRNFKTWLSEKCD